MTSISSLRLANQRLTGEKFSSLTEAVRWFGAVQAQELPGVKWGLGLRVQDISETTIEQQYNDGVILRTHIMRPTWHFVLPDDLVWMQDLTSANVKRAMGSYNRKLELNEALFQETNSVIVRALEDNGPLTRQELKVYLTKAGIATDVQRLAHIVMNAELDSLIVSGPMKGKQITYMLVKDRVAAPRTLPYEEALAMLARRYFTSHGPAQVKDFAWWSGLSMTDARQAVELLGTKLDKLEANDKTYWYAPPQAEPLSKTPRAFLLSVLDEYVIAYKDRSDLAFRGEAAKMLGETYSWVVILDGKLIGTWQRKITKTSVSIAVRLMYAVSAADMKAIKLAAADYASFLGLELELVI